MNLSWWVIVLLAVLVVSIFTVIFDIFQKKHSISRNFPLVGRLRFLLEDVGPELRQYIVTDNNAEKPFTRDERRWIYASSKGENNYFGFGTDNDIENTSNYTIIKHSTFPYQPPQEAETGIAPSWRRQR